MSNSTNHAARLLLVLVLMVVLAGCRQDMHDQAKLEPYEASDFFSDGVGARDLPVHTIPRGHLEADTAFFTGYEDDGSTVAFLPMELTSELLDRGQERYEIFCSPCHARTGTGRGMIVERGFKEPPSYHEERLRDMPLGYFFDVASNGYGLMSGYKSQIKPADRWAIAAWIRVLQRTRYAPAASLSALDRAALADLAGDDPGHAQPGSHGNESEADHGDAVDGEEHARSDHFTPEQTKPEDGIAAHKAAAL